MGRIAQAVTVIAVGFASMAATPALAVAGWDAVADFYVGNVAPPANPWSYGFGDGGLSFTPDTVTGPCYDTADYNCHFSAINYQRVGLYQGNNVAGASASTSNGIYAAPDALFLHPGPSDGQSSIVRFTIATPGTYSIDAVFEALDFYQSDGVVTQLLHNGMVAYSHTLSGTTGTVSGPGGSNTVNTQFAALTGDTFDFLVNKNGSYYSDSTGLKARIALLDAAPVPEPATWSMMLIGFGLIGARVRGRNGAAGLA